MTDTVLRLEIQHADIAALRDAYGKIQQFSQTDNRSWIFWSEFHGFNGYDCWHHSRVGPGRGNVFTYDLFLPWHRAYLVSFDHVVREQNPDAVLPWWDWTSARAHRTGIPRAYAEDDVGGDPNPLAGGPTPDMPGDPARRTSRNPRQARQLPSMTRPHPEWGLQMSVKEVLALPKFVDFSSQLQDIHDYVHGWVGGDMGVIATSAFDPLFWAHHAMIDRLWYLWQLKWGENNIPIDYLDKVLAPFPFTVRDVLSIDALGYEYAVSSATTHSPGHHEHGEH